MPQHLTLNLSLLCFVIGLPIVCLAQQAPPPALAADTRDADARVRETWPRVWAELQWIQQQGTRYAWTTDMQGPAHAIPGRNLIELNPRFLGRADYPRERWLIVVWHEYGHILFRRGDSGRGGQRSLQDRIASEHAAFEYSLQRAIDWAKNHGDAGPLREVLKNLRERSQAAQAKAADDPHPPAIRQLMSEPLWSQAESVARDTR